MTTLSPFLYRKYFKGTLSNVTVHLKTAYVGLNMEKTKINMIMNNF